MVCVFPGCPDVLARFLRIIRALIREDLPTFDFPEKANSGSSFFGKVLVTPHTVSSSAFLITIFFPLLWLCPDSIPNELSPKTIRLGSIPVTSRGKDNLFREPARHEPRKTFFLGKLDKTHCDATVHRDATSTFYKGGEKW